MSTLRAVIIDDEQKGIKALQLLVEKFFGDVKIVASTTDPEKGIALIEDYKPEIVFLDINMPHIDGFQLLQKLHFRGFSLIFTTAHQEYALKAIKNSAMDYLLKPVDVEDLKVTIEKVKKQREQKQDLPDISCVFEELKLNDSSRIPFHTKDKVEYISKKDIIRMESDSNYTHVFLSNGNKLMISKTIGDYENLLCEGDQSFMRVHQSHIVNLRHVIRFTRENGGTIITRDDSHLPLSKNKKEEFLKWLDLK